MTKRGWIMAGVFLIILFLFTGCGSPAAPGGGNVQPEQTQEPEELILATTTSTYDSGLLDYLLPLFEERYNYRVSVISQGTGQALETAKNGDADVVLVHARATELQMVEEGHFVDRHDVMYNDFVFVGPSAPEQQWPGIGELLAWIVNNKQTFISRGDDSGTHKKELSLWQGAGIAPAGDWYVSAGAGMGDTLRMADEMRAYTMTDRATYLSQQDKLELVIIFEGDPSLFNQYGVMAVNPANFPDINYTGAMKFIEFMISEEGQALIAGYQPFGDTLFFPNAE